MCNADSIIRIGMICISHITCFDTGVCKKTVFVSAWPPIFCSQG